MLAGHDDPADTRRRRHGRRNRHGIRPLAPDHGTRLVAVHDAPDREADPPALVCQVGSTTLRYHLSAIKDLHGWLVQQGDWVDLGAADEKKGPAPGTVEAWGRAADNPVGGWYGLRKGYRGRFGVYLPPLLEALGMAELTHDARNNRIRAI
jgi:hypothetical protein